MEFYRNLFPPLSIVMTFPDHGNNIFEASPQFSMNKSPRISENNHSNAFICPLPSNKETGSIFFKTRICHKFRFGNCPKGEHCTYAHGVGEIRKLTPNWKELAGPRNEEWMQFLDDDQKVIHKMGYNGEECPSTVVFFIGLGMILGNQERLVH